MIPRLLRHATLVLAVMFVAVLVIPRAMAQTPDPSANPAGAAPESGGAVYKPPLRGAPGGRVGGASRGVATGSLPTIELIAPADHTGETASAMPTLYFFVSQPVSMPTQFTISAPLQAKPLLETTFASPTARGLYALRVSDYHVQLSPGIVYTWSVAAIVDPQNWSRNVVASATIQRVTPDASVDGAVRAATPVRRVALLASAGLWYDAVAAATEAENLDRHAALDGLLEQVGLADAAAIDRAGGAPPAR
jgi:hypothetical protein